MDRRTFMTATCATGIGVALNQTPQKETLHAHQSRAAAAATTSEVIGDGEWIWTRPPMGVKGWLEPRKFEFRTRVEMRATGAVTQVTSTTAIPVELPEQRIDDVSINTVNCSARLRQVAPHAAQLVLHAPLLRPGATLVAEGVFQLTLQKQFFDYQKDQFPAEQEFPKEFRKQYLYNSPGIHTRPTEVKDLAEKLGAGHQHPWDKAHAFKRWVWENIHSEKAMKYPGVVSAIRTGVGDCEERACTFAALCRNHGIPTRTVWVPNHVWSEFCLRDEAGRAHWIPAHTSGYTWFGLTGAHELVMQKGDKVTSPDQRREMRFIHDWAKYTGPRPEIVYTAALHPLPSQQGADPGPGARLKRATGPWTAGEHELDKYLLNGDDVDKSPFKKFKPQVEPWE